MDANFLPHINYIAFDVTFFLENPFHGFCCPLVPVRSQMAVSLCHGH